MVKSKKPSKQRKMLYRAPMHRRARIMAANLSPELREKYGRRSFPVRVGDTVKIMRGDFSGIEGKVSEVDRISYRVYIDGVTREKASGDSVKVSIHPSNLMIMGLNLDDKWRVKALERVKAEGVA
ncbi:MAG: 50S ribosomal protein L24 [Candidatus Bathyarchaeia archaeon]